MKVQVQSVYTQLYPQRVLASVSPFYVRSGRTAICKQVIGSTMNAASAKSSSVVVEYFFKYQAKFCGTDGGVSESEHIFACVGGLWNVY